MSDRCSIVAPWIGYTQNSFRSGGTSSWGTSLTYQPKGAHPLGYLLFRRRNHGSKQRCSLARRDRSVPSLDLQGEHAWDGLIRSRQHASKSRSMSLDSTCKSRLPALCANRNSASERSKKSSNSKEFQNRPKHPSQILNLSAWMERACPATMQKAHRVHPSS